MKNQDRDSEGHRIGRMVTISQEEILNKKTVYLVYSLYIYHLCLKHNFKNKYKTIHLSIHVVKHSFAHHLLLLTLTFN